MWNLSGTTSVTELQDTLSTGDQYSSEMLLQEHLAVLSEVNDLLHCWEVEAEIVLQTEVSTAAYQNLAEPCSHRSSLHDQMQQIPTWVPAMLPQEGYYQRVLSSGSTMATMVQCSGAPASFPLLSDNFAQWAMLLRALLSPTLATSKAVGAEPQPVNLLHCKTCIESHFKDYFVPGPAL